MSSHLERHDYADQFLKAELQEVDPAVAELISIEAERQARRIILIPSESLSPLAVRQALGSVFQNLYAEGYPSRRMMTLSEEELLDYGQRLAYHRRYSDRRFYKGTEFADFIECLAQRRIAQSFATEEVPADQIHVNVQPLSGAAANLAVYETFLELDDALMGLALPHGGHLTHGSPFNISGQRYQVASYEVSSRTGRLDYDQIRDLARKHRPRIIIAGYTSYPWAPDWRAFRSICDEVGALLMADIAHTAGLVIGGAHPSPVGIADVITFTTHKTVCGPRGAVIMTTDPDKAKRIETAIFPGEQGGPHVQKFASMAVAFQIAKSPQFRSLQHRIVHNARYLADALKREGLTLAYGGTETHMLLVDLKTIDTPSGYPLRGEIAARVLDLCGIVCNKNTIPGDTSAADARGIRLGTTWITERGITEDQLDRLAAIIAQVLTHIHPLHYDGLTGRLPRGKVELDLLEEAKREVDELAGELIGQPSTRRGYPFHFYQGDQVAAHPSLQLPLSSTGAEALADASTSALLLDLTDSGLLLVRNRLRAQPFLDEALTGDIMGLEPGQVTRSCLLDEGGNLIDDVIVLRLEDDAGQRERYLLVTNPPNHERVKAWLRGLADGYVLFDEEDIFRKVEGPVVVEDLAEKPAEEQMVALVVRGPMAAELLGGGASVGQFVEAQIGGADAMVVRLANDEFLCLVNPERAAEVWEELLGRGAVGTGRDAWRALRTREGLPTYEGNPPTGLQLYQAGHAHLFHLNKPYFIGQRSLNSVRPDKKRPSFTWEQPPDGHRPQGRPLKRTPLYEAHRRLGAKTTPFAGWEMPVWYTSVLEEHRAVREAAGLFDVGHMGVFEIAGPNAVSFLDTVTTNYVRWLGDGESQYSYLLDPEGRVLDDLILYRRGAERYLMVVNAANEEKDWAWLNAVNRREVLIDRERTDLYIERPALLRDLKDPSVGVDQRMDIALQGPNSLAILQSLTDNPRLKRRLGLIQRTEFIEAEICGMELIIARTGYTGERFGYEIFVHPDQAVELWELLLEQGEGWGIKPAGLGARDSTRIEAGLPLYGHELAGPLEISPTEAGFGPYVKFHKPFFIGRDPYLDRNLEPKRKLIRFRVDEKGQRKIDPGDPVVTQRGRCIGEVTSCSLDAEGFQLGLAFVEPRYQREGLTIGIFPLPSRRMPKGIPKKELSPGDHVLLHVEAKVLPRFP
ncbi:MAG: glycine cleavage system aminomethyltransferase GcvT [Chloroflexota bacterium]|nr:glycine cleavage system aminomethyltransferase GcvT [Chloroflexota bacterium]